MAAERPETAEERLVAQALQRAFGAPVPPSAFLAGRAAVSAAASAAAEEAAADGELVGAALAGAFAAPVPADVKAEHVAAIRAAAQADEPSNVVPLRRLAAVVGRHAVAAVVAVSTMAGGTGMAAASSDALPGQMLYPVKRAVEQVMLTAAWTPLAEANVQTKLAARRLGEAEMLLAGGASADVVGPLFTEYERHVAAVEGLSITESAVELAVLEVKAQALREQSTAVAIEDQQSSDAAAPAPSETSSPAVTTTEPPTAGATESSTADGAQPSDPQPAPSSSTKPTSGSGSGSGGGSTAGAAQPAPEPTAGASPTASPSPSPSPNPTPSRTEPSGVGESKGPGSGQSKPEPTKPTRDPTPTPTADPRTPLPDDAPLHHAGPLADWEESSYTDGS